MSKKILIVAAHPDDEVLGCGGTIARHVAEADQVHVLLMADGVGARASTTAAESHRRLAAMRSAHEIMGVQNVETLGLPDNQMDSMSLLSIVRLLEPVIEGLRPSLVYTHHWGDLNLDHRLTHEAVITACRPTPSSNVSEIYAFEVLSSTEWGAPRHAPFVPNLFVDISDQLTVKMKALEAYVEEMRPSPHSRSLVHAELLARHRGNSVGIEAAEAFEVCRIIRKG